MNRFSTPGRRALLVFTAWLALASTQALAAAGGGGPSCELRADVNPATVNITDKTSTGAAASVQLNGAASKPNDASFLWERISGSGTLANTTSDKVTFTAPDVGPTGATTIVRLTVTGCGSSASTTVTINISNTNQAPHAVPVATPTSAHAGELVTLNGGDSWDVDSSTLTYSWQQAEGPSVVLSNANQAQTSFYTPNVAATTTLKFRLTVSDGSLQDTQEVLFSALWTNAAPVAALSCPSTVDERASVTLNGSASSDSDGGITSYKWRQLVGLPVVPDIETWNTASVTFNAPSLGFQQVGLVPFELTVKDAEGAASSATCYVLIHDVTAPVISGAQDILTEATSGAGANVFFAPTASDAVDGDLTFLLACAPPAGQFPLGVTPVSCSIKDSAKNLAGAAFNVTVADTISPVIHAPISVVAEAAGPDGAVVTFDATTTDAVDGNGVADCTPPSGSLFRVNDSTVTCTAEDSHHNVATPVSFPIHVMDTRAPTLVLPASQTLEATSPAGATATFTVSATDTVDGSVDATCGRESGDTFALGTDTVTCSATDAHGNVATGSFTITVQDTTAPAIDAPADITAEATSAAGAKVTYVEPIAIDIVDGEVGVICTPAPDSTFPLGTTPVHCNTTDTRGNSSGVTFNLTVLDTTPPALEGLVADFTVEATFAAGASVSYVPPTAIDLVDGNVTVSCTPASGTVFGLGETMVTCSATDTHHNVASDTFTVTVADTTPPAISEHADVGPIEATGPSGAAVSFSLPTAVDLVDGAVGVTCLPASGSAFSIGTHAVNCSATDSRGNTATSTFQVTVQDKTPPQISKHADVGPVEATGPSGAAVSFSLPTAVDLVDGAVGVTCLPASGSTFSIGTHAVNCSATDSRGNTATRTFQATVQDKTPPTLHYTGDVTVVVEAGSNSAVVNYTKPTAWDLVDGWNTTVTCTPESGQSFPVGFNTVECTASDSRGNTAAGSFKVHVQYAWSGFVQPVDNPNALNTAKAGSAIPVKFSLGGYYGMNIFDNGPASGIIGCTETSGTAIDQTVTAGSSSLQYDAGTKQYIYVWKTEKSWVGQCRILQFKLQDDTVRYALFKFK